MRIFVCEFVTGGGFAGQTLPPGLRHEGDLMLSAVVKDLADLPDIEVLIARDPRLPDPDLPARCATLRPGEDPWAVWARCVDDTEAVLPIAPETGGALARLSGLALAGGRILLGCRPEAIQLTASKRATAAYLLQRGISAVETQPAAAPAGVFVRDGWVLKPDDGAGSEHTYRLRSPDALPGHLQGDASSFVIQPYLPGVPSSLSLICRNGSADLLACNRQDVVIEHGVFRFRGVEVGGTEPRRDAFEPLAAAIAAAVPGLWGYVGVDLIDGPDGPVVLEINPRLTTAYAGLRRALGVNPAGLILAVGNGPAPRPVRTVMVGVMADHA